VESPVVTSAEMRTIEEAVFARGVTAEALMDDAAAGIARTVSKFFPTPGRCIVFGGKGNNAGDAFAAATLLSERGWQIETRLAFDEKDIGELAVKKLSTLRKETGAGVDPQSGRLVVIDGLLGLGAKPPLREPVRTACREINRLRRTENAFVFAVDIPTGLDGDSGETDEDCVVADFTVAIGYAKRGLIADRASNFVGRVEVVSLGEFAAEPRDGIVATADSLRSLLPRRNFNAYKNQFGRVGVVAGSKGLTGAALLCSLGALRAGAGLVELFVPEEIYPVIAASAPPEAMVKPIASYERLLDENVDVWAIGPGLGRERAAEILSLIEHAKQPMVIDADALNILSEKMAILQRPAGPRLLTPHPGEMKRIFPFTEGSRAEIAEQFCARYPVALLLKSSRTIVAEKNRARSYNTTGNPGMATGGMGDVLTGVCAALIAQKLTPYDAARLGAWICGRAAEIAIFRGSASEESLLPSDLLENLGRAFNDLRSS
jgi:hydroxyethylthiazole kinase-like uncharacterized protein yjeF